MALSAKASLIVLAVFSLPNSARAQAERDIGELFEQAVREQRVGVARKTKPVDARPARPGEIVVTIIAGQGAETQSPPAHESDRVVRNRCPATGNEEILITSAKFAERYEGPIGPPEAAGWSTYRPRGKEMLYFIVPPNIDEFVFRAPWGETMIARPGDAIVRDPVDSKDTYRIAAAAFECTYEVIDLPKQR
jgi:hypothetical protein